VRCPDGLRRARFSANFTAPVTRRSRAASPCGVSA
jgi:hypothetical protein